MLAAARQQLHGHGIQHLVADHHAVEFSGSASTQRSLWACEQLARWLRAQAA
jgi:hypothetical protein